MILHPGILALLSSSVIIVVIMLGACWYGIRILIRWNPDSSSEEQLQLERKTWLVSSLLNYALFAQIVSAILFVFTADDIHRLFVGAMCATGALNANLVGWLVLLIKGGLLFCASIWVVFNRLDQKTEDSPLVKKKYLLLLLMTPLVAFDLYTQWLYFTGLQPEVITSCCGSLFTAEGEGVAAELAALPAGQAMTLFFSMSGLYLVFLLLALFMRSSLIRMALFVVSVIFFLCQPRWRCLFYFALRLSDAEPPLSVRHVAASLRLCGLPSLCRSVLCDSVRSSPGAGPTIENIQQPEAGNRTGGKIMALQRSGRLGPVSGLCLLADGFWRP